MILIYKLKPEIQDKVKVNKTDSQKARLYWYQVPIWTSEQFSSLVF
jgi:hypothetical protein